MAVSPEAAKTVRRVTAGIDEPFLVAEERKALELCNATSSTNVANSRFIIDLRLSEREFTQR
jgi:hypothetical protein